MHLLLSATFQPKLIRKGGGTTPDFRKGELGTPKVVERAIPSGRSRMNCAFERRRTHEGDAIAAARRRLPMVEMALPIVLIGPVSSGSWIYAPWLP